MLNREQIQDLRLQFPIGTRIELIQIDDPAAPPVGMKGTVTRIDDIGDILVDWDNGFSLNNIVLEDDRIREI